MDLALLLGPCWSEVHAEIAFFVYVARPLVRTRLCAHRPQGLQEGQLGLDRLLLLVNTFLETKNTRQSISL